MSIEGELQSFENGIFTVKTTMGAVRIPASQVTCSGAGCPPGTEPPRKPALVMALGADVDPGLVQKLLQAFVRDVGGTLEHVQEDQTASYRVKLSGTEFDLQVAHQAKAANVDIAFESAVTLTDAQLSPSDRVLAFGAIVPIASAGVALRSVSLKDLARIFGGGVTKWSEISGGTGEIARVLAGNDRAAAALVRDAVLKPESRELAPGVIRSGNVADEIGARKHAIGLVGLSSRGTARALPIVGSCGLVASADAFSVKSGQYPLIRLLTARVRTPGLPTGLIDFLNFAADRGGQKVLADAGLIGTAIARAEKVRLDDWLASASKLIEFHGPDQNTGALFKELSQLVGVGQRLSLTVRGSEAGAILARDSIRRIAAALGRGEFDGNVIVFAGHTGTTGDGATSLANSKRLAQQVMAAVLDAAPTLRNRRGIRFAATGFGGVAPLFCGTEIIENLVNQRVEIWVRPL